MFSFLWNQKWFFYGIAVKNLLKYLYFKSVSCQASVTFGLSCLWFWVYGLWFCHVTSSLLCAAHMYAVLILIFLSRLVLVGWDLLLMLCLLL